MVCIVWRARASRACRRVTLSARLSSKHATESSRRSDTSQPLFGRDVERDATTLARRALALVRGGDATSSVYGRFVALLDATQLLRFLPFTLDLCCRVRGCCCQRWVDGSPIAMRRTISRSVDVRSSSNDQCVE